MLFRRPRLCTRLGPPVFCELLNDGSGRQIYGSTQLDILAGAADENLVFVGSGGPLFRCGVVVGKGATIEDDRRGFRFTGLQVDPREAFQLLRWTRNFRVGITDVELSYVRAIARAGVGDVKRNGVERRGKFSGLGARVDGLDAEI